jgi:hypothetical protein
MNFNLRYTLLFIGCVAHAEFLSLTLAHEFWNEALYHVLWPDASYRIWWILILIWPAWWGLLWKYGAKNYPALGMIFPVIIGLITMYRVIGYLLYFFAVSMGGLH